MEHTQISYPTDLTGGHTLSVAKKLFTHSITDSKTAWKMGLILDNNLGQMVVFAKAGPALDALQAAVESENREDAVYSDEMPYELLAWPYDQALLSTFGAGTYYVALFTDGIEALGDYNTRLKLEGLIVDTFSMCNGLYGTWPLDLFYHTLNAGYDMSYTRVIRVAPSMKVVSFDSGLPSGRTSDIVADLRKLSACVDKMQNFLDKEVTSQIAEMRAEEDVELDRE